MDAPSRRAFLAAAVAAGTSGCLGDTTTGTDTQQTDTATPTPTANTASPTPTTEETPTTDPATDSPTGTPSTSGAVAWRRAFDAPVTVRPAVGDGVVLAGSKAGTVRAYDPDGELLWAVDRGDPIQDLTVADGTALVLAGTNELASGHTLAALDAASGDERWTFSPTGWWLEVLAVGDGTAYVATADDALAPSGETLYALAVDGGDPEWETEIGDPREAVLTDETVFVSATGRTYAVDRTGGAERWRRQAEDVFGTLATVGSTVVYAVESDREGLYSELLGIDATTGDERWRFDSWTVTSTVTGDGALFVGGARTARLDPSDGSVAWEIETPGFLTDPSLTDGRLYAGGDRLTALTRDGEQSWTWTPDPSQEGVSAAGLADGTLYIDAYHDADVRNQYKFAVANESGEGRWAFENGTELTDLTVGAGVAVAGGADGRLYALR